MCHVVIMGFKGIFAGPGQIPKMNFWQIKLKPSGFRKILKTELDKDRFGGNH